MDLKKLIGPSFWKKFFIMLIAIFGMGFFLSFLRMVNWGTDPCTFMNLAISSKIGWTFGNWQAVLNIALLVLTIIFNWRLIGCGTIANMFLIGYTADFFVALWQKAIPEQVFADPSFIALKIAIFIAAIACFTVCAATYMNSNMGLSPYDALAKIISTKLPKVPFAPLRICYDSLAIVIGCIVSIGGDLSLFKSLPGSIIMAFALGPVITAVGRFMTSHLSIFKEEKDS